MQTNPMDKVRRTVWESRGNPKPHYFDARYSGWGLWAIKTKLCLTISLHFRLFYLLCYLCPILF